MVVLVPHKAIIIIVLMYSMSFSVLAAQYIIGDVFRLTLKSPVTGQVIKSAILGDTYNPGGIVHKDTINNLGNKINATNPFNDPANAVIYTYNVGKEVFLLFVGLYIFNFLYLMGISFIIIIPMLVLYEILFVVCIISLIRGVL
jgi:hypothetical protein